MIVMMIHDFLRRDVKLEQMVSLENLVRIDVIRKFESDWRDY